LPWNVSDIEEKQSPKSLPLETERRVLPVVPFSVGRMLAKALTAMATELRGLRLVPAPSGRKEVEFLGAVGTLDKVERCCLRAVHQGRPIPGT
jgi:hypothetical protein